MPIHSGIYLTTYCNKPHRLSDGVPMEHECFILNPTALRIERTEGAEAVIESGVAIHFGKVHRGAPMSECSICRSRHGSEVLHACE